MNLFISPPTPSPTLHLMLALIIQMVLGQMLVSLANFIVTFVGNNTERGGESVLSGQLFFISQSDLYTPLQLVNTMYVRNFS